MIAAAGGALLFLFLFLPWFGAGDLDLSGWEGQSSTDVYLLITAIVAVAAALAAGAFPIPGLSWNGATALLGAVGTILLIWLTVFDFPDGEDRKIGLYLSLLAVAAIAVGGYLAARDEAGPARPVRA